MQRLGRFKASFGISAARSSNVSTGTGPRRARTRCCSPRPWRRSRAMNLFILFYDYVDDMAERRGPVRPAHLEHAHAYAERGELVLGGALVEPIDGAVIVFRVDSPAAVETFVRNDPYVKAGLVTGHRI